MEGHVVVRIRDPASGVHESDEKRRSCWRVEDILGGSDCVREVLYYASLLGDDRGSQEKAKNILRRRKGPRAMVTAEEKEKAS